MRVPVEQVSGTDSSAAHDQALGLWGLIRSDFWRRIQLVDLSRAVGTERATTDYYRDAAVDPVARPIGMKRRLATIVSPGFIACFNYRIAHAAASRGIPVLGRIAFMLNLVICGIEIDPSARIGPGLSIGHTVGTTVGPIVMGRNCSLMSRVGIGARIPRDSRLEGVPTVGDNVWFMHGSGAAGPIHIGDNARLGANALLLEDCPAGAIVMPPRSRVVTNPPPEW